MTNNNNNVPLSSEQRAEQWARFRADHKLVAAACAEALGPAFQVMPNASTDPNGNVDDVTLMDSDGLYFVLPFVVARTIADMHRRLAGK